MATAKQTEAAKRNIKKAQAKWQSMSHRQHALAQPQGPSRARPGSTGKGAFYHIEVRPKGEFTSFRNQDVGDPGGLERLAGRRGSGSWATQAWLVSKEIAHPEGDTLVGDNEASRKLLATLSSPPVHQKGDIYTAHDRRNIPEREKPTPAQQKAWAENIKKAQAARKKATN